MIMEALPLSSVPYVCPAQNSLALQLVPIAPLCALSPHLLAFMNGFRNDQERRLIAVLQRHLLASLRRILHLNN